MKNKLNRNVTRKLILLYCFLVAVSINAQDKYFFEKISISDGLTNSVVTSTFQDHLGYLWIGTVDGLNRFDGYDIKVYKNIPNDSSSLPYNLINSISEDSSGNLLVGTTDYVSKFNRIKDKFENIPIDKGAQLNESSVFNFLRDSENRIWISTEWTGVQKYDNTQNKYSGINYRDYSGSIISFSSAGYVWDVTELKNGNILVADELYGIFIYNSLNNEFQPYFVNSNLNLKGIRVIYEDNTGKIWFAGKGDIYIYNPITFELESLNMQEKFPDIKRNIFYHKIYSNDIKLLISSDFGILETDLNGSDIKIITKDLSGVKPYNFYKDNFGIFWISTTGNGLIKFDPSKKPFQFFKIGAPENSDSKLNPVTNIVKYPLLNDNLIVANNSTGLLKFNRNTKEFTKIKELSLNRNNYNLLPDKVGNIWYSDNDNLIKLDLNSGKTENFPFPNINYSRGPFYVSNLKFGPDKKIYIANRQGVLIFNPVTKTFNRLPSIMNKSVNKKLLKGVKQIVSKEKPIASFLKVGEGVALSKEFELKKPTKILLVNLGEGRQTGLVVTMFDYGWLEDSKGNKLWSAEKIQNTFYAGGGFKTRFAFGCLDLQPGKYKLHYVSDIGQNYGNFNVVSPPDSQWYGIQVLPINDNQFSFLNEILKKELDNKNFAPFEMVFDIEFSRKYINTVWLAANGVGLIKYNIRDNTYKSYRFDDGTQNFPLINQISNILEDKDGILWLATSVGLIRFNPETEKHTVITQNEGLVSNVIVFMIEDYKGNLWFGTPGGISMLNKKYTANQLDFVNYDNADGLHDLPLNNSISMTDDGEIYYGGYGGLNAFFPGGLNYSLSKPIITSLKISGVPVEELSSELNLTKDISETDQIELPFSNNNLSFEFASIHYSRPAKNKLAFMLDGIDKQWNYTNRRFASYLNLPPGNYKFRLKGSNGDGVWNPEEANLNILINPPWWRTTLAYIGYGLLFVGIIFGIDRVQRKRILNRERASAALKEAELRARIAESESERKTKELEEARQLQLSMLPKELPQLPNLDIAVYMKTATEVGGDYYDFNVGIDGTLTVVLGDATGHGMKAGTMVTSAKSLFNSYSSNPDILFTFQEMTRCLKQMHFQSLAMCMTMLKINNKKLLMSSAGMPPVYLFRSENRVVEEHLMKGMPLGTLDNFPYELKKMDLYRGDTLLLMSDGFPELQNEKNEIYGYKQVRNLFEEVAEKDPDEIINLLKDEGSNWVNEKDPDDDVTFVVIKVK